MRRDITSADIMNTGWDKTYVDILNEARSMFRANQKIPVAEMIRDIDPDDYPAAIAYAQAYAKIEVKHVKHWERADEAMEYMRSGDTNTDPDIGDPDPGKLYAIISKNADLDSMMSLLEKEFGGRHDWMVECMDRERTRSARMRDCWFAIAKEMSERVFKKSIIKYYRTSIGQIIRTVRDSEHVWSASYRDETDVRRVGIGATSRDAAEVVARKYPVPKVVVTDLVVDTDDDVEQMR